MAKTASDFASAIAYDESLCFHNDLVVVTPCRQEALRSHFGVEAVRSPYAERRRWSALFGVLSGSSYRKEWPLRRTAALAAQLPFDRQNRICRMELSSSRPDAECR